AAGLGGPGPALRRVVAFRDAVLLQLLRGARAPRRTVGVGGAVPAVHDARALGGVGGAAAGVLAASGGHARLELLLGVVLAVVPAIRGGVGAVLLDAMGEELLHERAAGVGGMAGGDTLLGRGPRARRAAVLAGRLGGGLAVLADAVGAGVRRLAAAILRRPAGGDTLGVDAASEVGATVLARLRRRVAQLLVAAVDGRLANRGAPVDRVAL